MWLHIEFEKSFNFIEKECDCNQNHQETEKQIQQNKSRKSECAYLGNLKNNI